jgi:hypothetical protein
MEMHVYFPIFLHDVCVIKHWDTFTFYLFIYDFEPSILMTTSLPTESLHPALWKLNTLEIKGKDFISLIFNLFVAELPLFRSP